MEDERKTNRDWYLRNVYAAKDEGPHKSPTADKYWSYVYQRGLCEKEVTIEAPTFGVAVKADGVFLNIPSGKLTIIDAKFVESRTRAMYEGGRPEYIYPSLKNEFERYAMVVLDPAVPIDRFHIYASTPAAREFLDAMANEALASVRARFNLATDAQATITSSVRPFEPEMLLGHKEYLKFTAAKEAKATASPASLASWREPYLKAALRAFAAEVVDAEVSLSDSLKAMPPTLHSARASLAEGITAAHEELSAPRAELSDAARAAEIAMRTFPDSHLAAERTARIEPSLAAKREAQLKATAHLRAKPKVLKPRHGRRR
jgi:hypothetical protein